MAHQTITGREFGAPETPHLGAVSLRFACSAYFLVQTVKICIRRRKRCVTSSYYHFLIAEENIARIRVYSLHDRLLNPCSLATSTKKVLSLYAKCSRLRFDGHPLRMVLHGNVYKNHFQILLVSLFEQLNLYGWTISTPVCMTPLD